MKKKKKGVCKKKGASAASIYFTHGGQASFAEKKKDKDLTSGGKKNKYSRIFQSDLDGRSPCKKKERKGNKGSRKGEPAYAFLSKSGEEWRRHSQRTEKGQRRSKLR